MKLALNLLGREVISFEFYDPREELILISNEHIDSEIDEEEQRFGFHA